MALYTKEIVLKNASSTGIVWKTQKKINFVGLSTYLLFKCTDNALQAVG